MSSNSNTGIHLADTGGNTAHSFVSTESFGCLLSSNESSTYGYSAGLGLRQDNSKGSNTSPPDPIDSSHSYATYFLYVAVGMFAIYIVAFPRDKT